MVDSQGTSDTSGSRLEQLHDFIRYRVNTFIKWDLVRFFHDNPHTKDTAEAIARYVSRDPETVARALHGLVDSDVLTQEKHNGVEVFALASDESIRDLVGRFMEACHDRQFRVSAIRQVIKGM
jgi:hypothetical protein